MEMQWLASSPVRYDGSDTVPFVRTCLSSRLTMPGAAGAFLPFAGVALRILAPGGRQTTISLEMGRICEAA